MNLQLQHFPQHFYTSSIRHDVLPNLRKAIIGHSEITGKEATYIKIRSPNSLGITMKIIKNLTPNRRCNDPIQRTLHSIISASVNTAPVFQSFGKHFICHLQGE
jgi:hypothetical protein